MTSPVLGIDLGTTNSVVAIADGSSARVITDPDGHRLIPSCVSFHPDDTILVGHAARDRRLLDAENTVYSIKRLIGRPFSSAEVQRAKQRFPFSLEASRSGGVQIRTRKGEYSLPEISAMVLRHLRKVAELALGTECKRAVITVPANFNELQRSATQAAGKVAGLEVMRILNEPTAATLAYGYGKEKPETIAVYDLGGGTFDITILHLEGDVFEVISTAGDTFLGGDDVDLAIADRMVEACLAQHRFDARREPQAFERMRAASEWAKCQLSSVLEAELTLEELFADASGQVIDFTFKITRDELEQKMRPLIARSFDVVGEALREAGKRPKEIDSVVMVGGSTRIPLVRSMVAEFFQKPPRIDIDPDLVVAQGAAIHGWTLAGRPGGQASIRPPTLTLAKVPLRKITVANPGGRRSRPQIAEEVVPRGPAFAPEESPLVPVMPLGSRSIAAALAGPRPVSDVDPMARTSLESPVAVIAPPTTVGVIGGAGLLLDLDDPLVREAAKRATRDPSARGAAAPKTAIEPIERALDAPFDAPEAKRSRRHDPTTPFGVSGLPTPAEPAALEDPFAAAEPLPLPEPAPREPPGEHQRYEPRSLDEPRRHEPRSQPALDLPPSGLFEVEMESIPPGAPSELPRAAPPPPPPPPRPPARPPIESMQIVAPPMPPPLPPQPPPLAPRIAELPMPAAPAPLLMDVIPLTLSLETAGGWCAAIVPRNAPVPAEKSRVFSTSRDGQDAVEVRICQGESLKFAENELLGTLVLDRIPKAPRGKVQIEISFLLDASGILDVRAVDLATQRAQQTRIALQGGIDPSEIEAMRKRQERELR